MKNLIHIVGNGPSKELFIRLKDQYKNDLIFGCNKGDDRIDNFKALFIHDKRVFTHLIDHKEKLPFPFITLLKHKNRFENEMAKRGMSFYGVIPSNWSYPSSGHDAIRWCIENEDCDELHLWGFDSINNNDISSDSKDKIDGSIQSSNLIPKWKSRFKELFTLANKLDIIIIVHD